MIVFKWLLRGGHLISWLPVSLSLPNAVCCKHVDLKVLPSFEAFRTDVARFQSGGGSVDVDNVLLQIAVVAILLPALGADRSLWPVKTLEPCTAHRPAFTKQIPENLFSKKEQSIYNHQYWIFDISFFKT